VGLSTGAVGLLLMALGALGGIESGITDGETFDASQHLRRPRVQRDGKPMGATARIYLTTLQTSLTTTEATAFFGTRGMTGQHICQNPNHCCRRGLRDMLANRVEHFARSRQGEVARLSEFPRHRRPQLYLDETLRPA